MWIANTINTDDLIGPWHDLILLVIIVLICNYQKLTL